MKLKNNYSKQKGPIFFAITGAAVLLLIVLLGIRGNWMGTKPVMMLMRSGGVLSESPVAVGLKVDLQAKVTVKRGGLCHFSGRLVQGAKALPLPEASVSETKFFGSSGIADQIIPVHLELAGQGFTEGPAVLELDAANCALFKRRQQVQLSLAVDLSPPQVSVTSSQHYINQGGAEVLTYHVSPDAVWSGVQVGQNQFVGHTMPGSNPADGNKFAFFVYSYDLPPGTKIEVLARDAAGNQSTAEMSPAKFFPQEFRHRDLPIDDNFIQTKVADIIARTPEIKSTGDNLSNFLLVNRDLRKKNAAFLREIAAKSAETFYWKDAFKPLGNAAIEASFADYRSYMYNGQKVDEQVHLGFDMAVTEKYPVSAGNAGRVAFAGYLGIYGNTVLIDHGYGLTTLYGHLSGIDVKVGDLVTLGQRIGNSGATGLAGGDHLHFSLLVDGVQTNPIEFWDQHWIDDHVYLRLPGAKFGEQTAAAK